MKTVVEELYVLVNEFKISLDDVDSSMEELRGCNWNHPSHFCYPDGRSHSR